MFRRIPHLLLLLVVAALAAACGTDDRPPVPNTGGAIEAALGPTPEIERWFRENRPASGARIEAGDRISIAVQGHPDLAVTREVPPDGSVPLYRTEVVLNALRKTTQELESEISEEYSKAFTKPYVTVELLSTVPRSIYILGAVKSPGEFTVRPNDRITLLQAIARAGGATATADLGHVTIRRYHEPTKGLVSTPYLDVQRAIEKNDNRDNLVVEAEDTIVVPDGQEARIWLLGFVNRPGAMPWRSGMTVSGAVADAGGFARFAKTSKIKIVRGGREQMLWSFDDFIDGNVEDFQLQPNDVIYVDER